uniref:Putative S-adenosyl-L-methionine-dependent methyltransferase n=1 Tax=Moniliophthora roreri TaxID=221103 RepID=A0A0W0FID2_MONRR
MSSWTNAYIKTVNIDKANRGFLLSTLESALNLSQDCLASIRWQPVRSLARGTVLKALANIERGELHVVCGDETWTFGKPYILTSDGYSKPLKATVRIMDQSVWTRLCLHADFGFADAFMLGLIEASALTDIFQIFVLNRKQISELSTLLSPFFRFTSYISNSRLANKVLGSKSNISAHYDLSNDIFAAFLSWDMTYSCAIFDEESGGCVGDLLEERFIAPPRKHQCEERSYPPDDLERGQLAKLHLLARRARITEGCRVLEIGCGWGSFAILVAKEYGAQVDAITISEVQKFALEENIRAAGLSHVITVHLMDYRKMPESFHHAFDAVVSIGVMEHGALQPPADAMTLNGSQVGIEFMEDWFEQMSWAMKVENSFNAFTMSTVPDTRWEIYSTEVDFVRKYIYPGGQLSSVATLVKACTQAGLNVESLENIGPHYARTLREWRCRFERNFESHIGPALQLQYPSLSEADIEIFRRKWIYYFAYSEAGFGLHSVSDHVFTLTREANLRL